MINPKSLKNLTTFKDMDANRHKEISSKGGKASGASRKRKGRLTRKVTAYLSLSMQEMKEMQEIYRLSDISCILPYADIIIELHNIVTDEAAPIEKRERAVEWIRLLTAKGAKHLKRD